MPWDDPMPLRLDSRDVSFDADFAGLLAQKRETVADVEAAAREIIADVVRRGDAAVVDATRRFDHVELTPATIETWARTSPVIAFMNLELVEADAAKGTIAMKMPMRAEFERGAGSGQFHGGPIAALIDTVGDFAVAIMVKGGTYRAPVPALAAGA
jgi:hypothetical protein